jgi:hypothetical protein
MNNSRRFFSVPLLFALVLPAILLVGFQNCAPKKTGTDDGIMAGNLISTVPHPTFTFTVSDPGNILGTRATLFKSNLAQAGKLWALHFNSKASLQVKVTVQQSYSNTANGESVMKVYIGKTASGLNIAEEGAAYELRTGIDPNGTDPDISIIVDPDYINNELTLDPQPTVRTAPIPPNHEDAVSVFMHELGHAVGYNGYLPTKTSVAPAGWTGVYDKFIYVDANKKFWYNGPKGKAAYGGQKIPLANETNYHMGNELSGTLAFSLMPGFFIYQHRYNVDSLVIAVLQDLGLPAM